MTTRYYKYLETFDTRILTGQFGAKARLCRCGKWPQSPADFFIFFLIRLAAMWLFYSPNDRCWSDCFVWRWHEWDPHWLQTSNNCLTSDWPPILSHFNILQPDFSMTSMTCWDLLDTDIEVSPWFHRGGCIEGGGRRAAVLLILGLQGQLEAFTVDDHSFEHALPWCEHNCQVLWPQKDLFIGVIINALTGFKPHILYTYIYIFDYICTLKTDILLLVILESWAHCFSAEIAWSTMVNSKSIGRLEICCARIGFQRSKICQGTLCRLGVPQVNFERQEVLLLMPFHSAGPDGATLGKMEVNGPDPAWSATVRSFFWSSCRCIVE